MSATATTIHEFSLPYTDEDLVDHEAQLDLDREAAELRAELVAIGFDARQLRPPAETGTPAEIDAYLDRVAKQMAKLPAAAEVISKAAGVDPLTGERRYSAAEVVGWFDRAIELDISPPRLYPRDVEGLCRLEVVPNARIREAAEDRDVFIAAVARKISGDGSKQPDTTYAQRLLGAVPTSASNGYAPTLRLFMDYEHAVAMADVLDLDYHEIGV